MLPAVAQLLQLQERDQRIRSLTKDLKDNPKLQERAKSRLADDEAGLAAAQGRMRDVELKIKNLELDVQTRRNTIARLKEQQFATRKNEEFQAMGHEIQRYEKEVTGLEDQELELMEQLEGVKPDFAAAQQKLAATKKLVEEELKELAERAKAIEARIGDLKNERTALVEPIDPTTLSLYERLMKSKGDSAVVLMEAGICTGCHVKVVSGTLQSLKADENITQCEQCGRILYQEA
jgi:predicted  nucleic acid-binding Zn-ribbon protein